MSHLSKSSIRTPLIIGKILEWSPKFCFGLEDVVILRLRSVRHQWFHLFKA